MHQNYTLITTQDELAPLLEDVARHETVAIDTEADSMHHYREKLCLIQLGLGERQWIVDPLAQLDLEPLTRLLEQRELILHGADYDLRLLYRTFNFTPARIFDTMLAAQLLGKPRIGLAALVQDYCQVILPKEGQKADWSRRPLPPELLAYAADDTRYLDRVVDALKGELIVKERLEWHGEICTRLIGMTRETRIVNGDDAWRIKGGKHLTGRPAAVLRELWKWREELASQLDRPPFKVANGEFLLLWAQWAIEHPEADLAQVPERPEWLRGSRRKSFDEALVRGFTMPPDDWPGPLVNHGVARSSREEEALLRKVLEARDAVAVHLELDPGVLGPREALRQLIRQRPLSGGELRERSPLMCWQNDCLAEAILPILQTVDVAGGGDD